MLWMNARPVESPNAVTLTAGPTQRTNTRNARERERTNIQKWERTHDPG
jgi:hypothetical protein